MYTDYFPPARLNPGRAWFVAPLDDDRSGLSWNAARNSIQSAINLCVSGDYIYVAPGTYDEVVTIDRGLDIAIIGVGPLNSVRIAPTTDSADALTCHADGVLLQNIHAISPDTSGSVAFTATGSGLRCVGCKFTGAAQQVLFGPGSQDHIDLGTEGVGADAIFENCVFGEGVNGFVVQGTDYGPAARVILQNCSFYQLDTTSVTEQVGDGGAAGEVFTNLIVRDCSFEPSATGTEPTNYFLLNGSNANTGLVTGCRFTVSLTSGKNLVSTKVLWSGNYHPAGLSTGQPS